MKNEVENLLEEINCHDPGMDTRPEITFYQENQGRKPEETAVSEAWVTGLCIGLALVAMSVSVWAIINMLI